MFSFHYTGRQKMHHRCHALIPIDSAVWYTTRAWNCNRGLARYFEILRRKLHFLLRYELRPTVKLAKRALYYFQNCEFFKWQMSYRHSVTLSLQKHQQLQKIKNCIRDKWQTSNCHAFTLSHQKDNSSKKGQNHIRDKRQMLHCHTGTMSFCHTKNT